MKREAKVLREKAIESLTLAIELFNRPWSMGRPEAVLILPDRALPRRADHRMARSTETTSARLSPSTRYP